MGIGADLFQRQNAVGVSRLIPIGPMAMGKFAFKDRESFFRKGFVNGKGIFGWFDGINVVQDIAKEWLALFKKIDPMQRAHRKLHDRPNRAGVPLAGGVHGCFLSQ